MPPADAPILSLDIELTRLDLAKATVRLSLSRSTWLMCGAIGALLAYATQHSARHDGHVYPLPVSIIMGLFLFCAFMVFVVTVNVLMVQLRSGRRKGILGAHHYAIHESGLIESTEVNESLAKWGSLYKILKTPRSLYFFQAPGLVHILPRRCFPTDRDFEAFAEEVSRRNSDSSGLSR